jgi:adenylate kinase family enzyme
MRRIISIIAEPSVKKDARLNELLEGREEGYTVISAEKLLRKEVENETKQGEVIKKYTSVGKTVPDYIVINTILRPLRSAEGDVIFIAFPTTEVQKWAFDLIE